MTRRKFEVFAAALVVIVAAASFLVPAVQARISWYYVGGQYDLRNVLVTCEAETPIFRMTALDTGTEPEVPVLSSLEVYLACNARDRLLRRGTFAETGLFGQNRALTAIVEKAGRCISSADLPAELVASCRDAHFDAIDWLLGHDVDINAGELGTILHTAIHASDDEMFAFLLSRGADPEYRPPAAYVPGEPDERSEQAVDTGPKSAVELLELQLAHLDESEFPEVAAALRRMQAAVGN